MRHLQTRRPFLKALLYGLALPGLWVAYAFAKRAETVAELEVRPRTIAYIPEPGVRFDEKAIIVTNAEGVSVFASACPHLGCRLDRTEGAEIVCPCHGSRFDQHGRLLRGPATRGLTPLRFEHDAKAGVLRIYLNSP